MGWDNPRSNTTTSLLHCTGQHGCVVLAAGSFVLYLTSRVSQSLPLLSPLSGVWACDGMSW